MLGVSLTVYRTISPQYNILPPQPLWPSVTVWRRDGTRVIRRNIATLGAAIAWRKTLGFIVYEV